MFGHKKEKKEGIGLPDLPLPQLNNLQFSKSNPIDVSSTKDDSDNETQERPHTLPTFPSAPNNESFNHSAIKDAVNSSYPPESPDTESMIKTPPQMKTRVREMDEWQPESHMQRTFTPPPVERPAPKRESTEPIFVRIDKFESARNSLDSIEESIKEIEKMIGNVREIKKQEEDEIMAWEKDIEQIKARLSNINENIFGKI